MKLKTILIVSALGAISVSASADGLIPNSLLVLRTNNTASNAASSISLLNYTSAGVLGENSTYAVPSTGGAALTQSGTAGSEGALSISSDLTKISFVGYRANSGAAAVVGTASAATNRVVGTISLATGAIDTSTAITGQFSGNNIRSSYVSGSAYYAVGANSGLVSGTVGSAAAGAALGTSTTNLRVVNGFGGNVYFSTGSGAQGIYQYDPSATGKQTLVVNTNTVGGQTSPYDFQFVTATSLLVADATVGIKLYTKTGSNWAVASTLAASASSSFTLLGGSIYFTAADGSALKTATFDGTSFGTVTTLATAGAGQAFRGVQAVPEPGSMVALAVGGLGLLRRRRSAK